MTIKKQYKFLVTAEDNKSNDIVIINDIDLDDFYSDLEKNGANAQKIETIIIEDK